MSYVIRDTPHDLQAYAEQRDILTPITHSQTLNVYDFVGNSLLPLTYNENLNGFTLDNTTGELTYIGINTEYFELDAVIQGLAHDTGGATVIQGAVFVNNVEVPNTGTYYNISSTALDSIIYHYKIGLTLNSGDVVDFRFRNISRTETGSFYQYHLIIKTILNLI